MLIREGLVARLAILAYSFVILFTWLNYAAHARYWLQYDFVVIGDPIRNPERFYR